MLFNRYQSALPLVLIFTLTATSLYAQNFQGIVEYEMSYIIKDSTLTVEGLEKEMGKKVITYFKKGCYKEITDSEFMSYTLFRHQDNRVYFKHSTDVDTLGYFSTLDDSDQKFDYKIVEQADSILGEVCDLLIVHDRYGTKKHYYSSKYSLDPKYYRNFTASNMNKTAKLKKAIYLRLEMEYDPYIITVEAKKIKRKRLSNKIFKVPKHKVLVEFRMK